MTQIDAAILRRLRTDKHWSQERLAQQAGGSLNKGTVYRIENGQSRNPHPRTTELLAKALGVKPGVLKGEEPLPESDPKRPAWAGISDARFAMDNRCRNALSLAALQYGVKAARILELAPFLFVCAVEGSLRRRSERLEILNTRVGEVEDLRPQSPHLSRYAFFDSRRFDILNDEETSIAGRDIFGEKLANWDDDMAGYVHEENNPMVSFLQHIALKSGVNGSFGSWSGEDAPRFEVCREQARALVGEDDWATEAVLDGEAPLYKMTADVRRGPPEGRALWVKSEVEAYFAAVDEAFPDLANIVIELDEPEQGPGHVDA